MQWYYVDYYYYYYYYYSSTTTSAQQQQYKYNTNNNINIQIYNDEIILDKSIPDIRKYWESTSYQLEIKQIGEEFANKELNY